MEDDVETVRTSMAELVPVMEEVMDRGGAVNFLPRGNSMYPTIRNEKDTVKLVRPKGRLKKYDIILYKRPNAQYVLHRIIKVRKDDYVLRGDNQDYNESRVKDLDVIAVLTEINRDGEIIKVTDRKFKIESFFTVLKGGLRVNYRRFRIIGGKVKRKILKITKSK